MAFCAYCGKQLADGQACDCAASHAANQGQQGQQPVVNQGMNYQGAPYQQQGNPYQGNPYQGNPYQQGPYPGQTSEQARQAAAAATQTASQAASKAGNVLSETLGHFLLILKAPATAGRNFVAAANVKVSITLIILQAIVSAIFALIVVGKANSYMIVFDYVEGELFSKGKTFFITLLMSLVFSMIFALLSWLVAGLSKAQTSYQQMMAVAGVRATLVMPTTVVSIVVFFINPIFGIMLFFVIGWFWAIIVQSEALQGILGLNNNIKVYLIPIVIIIFGIIVGYPMIQMGPQTISSIYLKYIENLGDFLDVIDMLL